MLLWRYEMNNVFTSLCLQSLAELNISWSFLNFKDINVSHTQPSATYNVMNDSELVVSQFARFWHTMWRLIRNLLFSQFARFWHTIWRMIRNLLFYSLPGFDIQCDEWFFCFTVCQVLTYNVTNDSELVVSQFARFWHTMWRMISELVVSQFARFCSDGVPSTHEFVKQHTGYPYKLPKTIHEQTHLELIYDCLDMYLWLR